jgi:hypothetical protein
MPPYFISLEAGIGGTGENLAGTVYSAPTDTVGTVVITVRDSYGANTSAIIEVVSAAGSGPLALSPSAVSIYVGNTVTLEAQGGSGPYTFELVTPLGGSGEALIGTGSSRIYTAPSDAVGDAVVRVSDSGGSVDATISVSSLSGDVDYVVVSETYTGGTVGGGVVTGEFEVINNGGDTGTQDIWWTVHSSIDDTLGAGDILIDSDTTAALSPTALSGIIEFSGTWPVPLVDTTYYLIISITASDDFPDADNVAVLSQLVTAPPVSDIDYRVNRIDETPVSALAGSAISHTFDFINDGSEAGVALVSWTAYISSDAVPDSSEIVDTGTESPLIAGDSMVDISIDGSWPGVPGLYYLIVKVSSTDDINPSNDIEIGAAVTVNAGATDIDYIVTNISEGYPTVTSQSLIAETFDLSNIGGLNGTEVIFWTAWASDDTSLDGDEIELGSGSTPFSGLNAGAAYNGYPISGTWPADAGVYYLIVELESTDETVTGNNYASAGPFIVKDPPDYTVSAVNYQSDGLPGTPMSDFGLFNFTISEVSGFSGSMPVSWDVFVSTDNVLDANDSMVKSGSIAALAGSSDSDALSFGDVNWPAFGSFYYIIISVAADDDDNGTNDVYISPTAVTVPELYTETVDSTGSGPSTGSIAGVSSPPLDGGDLDKYQLFKVNDLMDAPKTQYDTYRFVLGPDASSVEMYAVWATGTNTIQLYLWDEFNGEWSSMDLSADREPASDTAQFTGLVPGRTYYVGVEFRDNVGGGLPYELYIWAD